MAKEIKSIDKKSFARIMALIYGLVGFIMAVIVAIYTIVNIVTRQDFQGSATLIILFNIGEGLLIGVVTALLTAGLGWIIGYITAGVYNWFARKVGGVKVEFEDAATVEKREINNN